MTKTPQDRSDSPDRSATPQNTQYSCRSALRRDEAFPIKPIAPKGAPTKLQPRSAFESAFAHVVTATALLDRMHHAAIQSHAMPRRSALGRDEAFPITPIAPKGAPAGFVRLQTSRRGRR
ncbi:hypothetical protein EIQ04_19745 [Xanthomonas campestris pv. raphani]